MFMYQMYMNDFYLSLIIHNGANILNSSYIVYFSKLKNERANLLIFYIRIKFVVLVKITNCYDHF